MTMGDRIKFLRERKGITMEELGEKIGVQKSAIRKYEKGDVENIKRSSVKIMAELFEVSPSYLMFGDGEDTVVPVLNKEEARLIEIYRAMNAAGKKSLMKQAEMHMTDSDFTEKANVSQSSADAAI